MSRRLPSLVTALTLVLVLAGCHPQQPFYFGERGELAHYRDMATEIEYPDVCVESLDDVKGALPPATLLSMSQREPWDLTLEDAIHDALCNGKVLRELADPSGLQLKSKSLSPINVTVTTYDPAIAESDPRGGVEGALSAFDAQLSSSVVWQKLDTPVNTVGSVSGQDIFAQTDIEDQGTFQARLQKTNAAGGTAAITHNVKYTQSNSPLRMFPSDWQVNIEAEVRQPLLQGAGVTFNRIAGPTGFPGFNQGVMIARVNTDISLTNFEEGVRNFVARVEESYWELYDRYRVLEAAQNGMEATLNRWRVTFEKAAVGATGGEAAQEALNRNDYYVYRATAERALNELYKAEANLRWLMGIATSDCRLIRPCDEPTTAAVSFDWCALHSEALVRNVELRGQKWLVKHRELELVAAKNYLLPRLDAVARYRWLGLGDDLIGADETRFRQLAYNEMLDGNYQEWTLGLDFRMTLGFRKEMANVRNAQLQLAKERALLQENELLLCDHLATAIRDLDANHALIETQYNRRLAAERQVKAWQVMWREGMGGDTVQDALSRAQRELTQAQMDYWRSVVDYNQSIVAVHFHKGSLLEYNGVYLTEGPWPQKAYFDACRLARSRDAATYMDYGMTLPRVMSRGPISQNWGTANAPAPAQAAPTQQGPETVPTPAPNPTPTPAPKPTPAGAAPTVPVVPAKPQAQPNKPAVAPQAAAETGKGSTPRASKGYDLGQMNLDALGQRPAGQSTPAAQPVRQVNYQEPSGADPGWTSAASSSPGHERLANLPPVEAHSSTPGWARAQH